MSTQPRKCWNCAYWKKEGAQTGRCRRYPPTVIHEAGGDGKPLPHARFPLTGSHQWCGEHELAPDREAPPPIPGIPPEVFGAIQPPLSN